MNTKAKHLFLYWLLLTLVGCGGAPVANVNGPYNGTEGTLIAFSSQGSIDLGGSIVAYHWDFGDGGTSDLANPTYTYNTVILVF